MAVETLTAFPASIVAGNTVRLSLSDGDYPSGSWALTVVFRNASGSKSFTATAAANNGYTLVLPAADTAKLTPGTYAVTFLYTSGDERDSGTPRTVEVLPDPSKAAPATVARNTLVAMENALLRIATGTNQTASFNGQSFTKKNLKDLQDAIERQKGIVRMEDQQTSGRRRSSGIGVRFSRSPAYCCD